MAKKVSKKTDKKTVKKSGRETRIKVWRYANFVLLLVSFVMFAAMIQTTSVADVAAGVYKITGEQAEEVKMSTSVFKEVVLKSNLKMLKTVLVVSGSYALANAINYFFYINRRKFALIIALLAEVIICSVGIASDYSILPFACGIVILPIMSGLMYLRIMKLEEE